MIGARALLLVLAAAACAAHHAPACARVWSCASSHRCCAYAQPPVGWAVSATAFDLCTLVDRLAAAAQCDPTLAQRAALNATACE